MMNDDKELVEKISEKVEDILTLLRVRDNEGIEDTPNRVAKHLIEATERNRKDGGSEFIRSLTSFGNYHDYELEQKGIPFSSLCSHHFLPFFGEVEIYIKAESAPMLGLSKFKRIVDYFSKKPTTQEELTSLLASKISYALRDAKHLEIKVTLKDCIHTCMSTRGVKTEAKTTTRERVKW